MFALLCDLKVCDLKAILAVPTIKTMAKSLNQAPGIPGVFHQVTRQLGLGLLLLTTLVMLGAQPVMAIALGDDVSQLSDPMMERVVVERGSQVFQALHRRLAEGDLTAFTNANNQVFRIEIQSQADLPPNPAEYMGTYGQFVSEEELLPLRGRIVRYQEGNRLAEWVVYGLSGDFKAQAISFDLAPEASSSH
ncbi:MAG: hypothetical protein ACFCU9_00515 [Cyanophyceae cyanobacterium]